MVACAYAVHSDGCWERTRRPDASKPHGEELGVFERNKAYTPFALVTILEIETLFIVISRPVQFHVKMYVLKQTSFFDSDVSPCDVPIQAHVMSIVKL
jgi:hypothetical protein